VKQTNHSFGIDGLDTQPTTEMCHCHRQDRPSRVPSFLHPSVPVFPACFITCPDRYHPLISLSHGTHKDTSACANSWCLLSHSYHFSRQSAPTNSKIPSRRGPCLQLKRSRYCRKQEMEKPTIHNLLTQIFTRAWQWMKAVQETPNPIQIARRAWKEASRVR
jgi:hypothetical protein